MYTRFRKMYTRPRAHAHAGEQPINVHLTDIRFKVVRCTCTCYGQDFVRCTRARGYAYARARERAIIQVGKE